MNSSGVKYFRFTDAVVIHANNKTITVGRDDKRYAKLIEAIDKTELAKLPSLADTDGHDLIRSLLKIRSK